jgi:polar amino acid transport system substrate-binding protein
VRLIVGVVWPGSRVLDGHFATGRHAMALPKEPQAALASARTIAEEAKREGLVRAAIKRAALRGVVE